MLQVTMKQLNNVTVAGAKYFIKYNTKCLTFLNNKNKVKYSLMAGNIYMYVYVCIYANSELS